MAYARSFLVIVKMYSHTGESVGVTSQVIRDAEFGTASAFADHLRAQADNTLDIQVLDYISSFQPEG